MSAKIIAIYNQKGGCAKTQTSMQIAGELALRGNRVWVVDMDKQGTSTMWSSMADATDPFPATVSSLSVVGVRLFNEILKNVDSYDYIIIDCPPAIDSEIPWNALLCSDIAIIPVLPAMDNIWASKKAQQLGIRAMEENPDLRVYFLASKVGRAKVHGMCIDALKNDKTIPLFKSQVGDRVLFVETQALGTCVTKYDPKSAASTEIKNVVTELLSYTKGTRHGN